MDAPQWYNSRLWSTSKQSIDGRPIKPPMRPQSATNGNYRPGFNIQPLTGIWSNFAKGPNMVYSQRDQSFISNPYRPSKTTTNKLSNSFSSKYFNSLTPNFNFLMKNNDRIKSARLFSLKSRLSNQDEISPKTNDQNKAATTFNRSQMILKPSLIEYEQEILPLPTKKEIVHGNINIQNSLKSDNDGDSTSETDLSQSFSDSLNVSQSHRDPQTTPRTPDVSSQFSQPKKSILKKTSSEFVEPRIPTFNIYNNFYPSRVRTISASSKSLISAQMNSLADLRKSLKSAPGSKREVRFDMTINNVIEYTPND